MITIIAKNTIKPGMAENYKEAVKPLIEASQKESGCISYELFQDCGNPNILTLIEEWESEEAIKLHNATEHFTQIVPKLQEFQAGATEINLYKSAAL